MEKRLVIELPMIFQNLGSSDSNRIPNCRNADVYTTLLARDYKGFSNYGSNGVIEIKALSQQEVENLYGNDR